MPLYDYYCKDCLKSYEILIRLDKSNSKIKCPHCGRELKKIIAPVLFSIK